ncbi:MarR family transcriptional regulator [Jonesiaceae bacterium BS-20]|uniref:MarR family transcriptional regulator n=1 Tax=Jonesiaceae bacterium BS-20 TaxID=3120821 RepID=A0AAU7DVK5_9MICO
MTETHAPETQWLNEEETEAWKALVDLSVRLPATLDSRLQRDCDLSFYEYMVLAMLSEQEDWTLNMGQLAQLTSGSLSRLSHVTKRLESSGFVSRTRGEKDKRQTYAKLTDLGWEKIVASAPIHVAQVREVVFSALDCDQVKNLFSTVNAIRPQLN